MFGRAEEHCFSFPKSQFERNQQRASTVLREISMRFDIPIIQTSQFFCSGDTCRAEKDGVILYRDQTHLNTAGAKYLGSRLKIPWPGGDGGGSHADLGNAISAN